METIKRAAWEFWNCAVPGGACRVKMGEERSTATGDT